jgi:hypothetical protein
MSTWQEIEKTAPEFAERVRERFAAGIHKTIATLRADGSPRISGSELEIADGEVTFGMMDGSLKLKDLRRDNRMAVHSPTLDPPKDGVWLGDAKLAGRAVETAPPEKDAQPDGNYFRLDITEVVLTYVGTPADHLVIESWHENKGYRRRKR